MQNFTLNCLVVISNRFDNVYGNKGQKYYLQFLIVDIVRYHPNHFAQQYYFNLELVSSDRAFNCASILVRGSLLRKFIVVFIRQIIGMSAENLFLFIGLSTGTVLFHTMHVSFLSQSIALFKSYKSMYFSISEDTCHFRNLKHTTTQSSFC